jgi:outer membrane protein assembly factor BamB
VYQPFTTGELNNGPIRAKLDIPTYQEFTVPVISNGFLYFTYSGENAYFYAIDARTGRQITTLKFDHNSISAPAAKGNVAFFGTWKGHVYAYDVEQQATKWSFKEKDCSFAGSIPMLDGDALFIYGSCNGLYSFAAETGEVKWVFKSSHYLQSPAISGDRVIVLSSKGRLMSLDRGTGTKQWEVKVDDSASSPAILDDQIFLRFGQGEIRAYALVDGTLKWKSKVSGGAGTGLVLYDKTVFFGGREHSVIGIDAATGLEKVKFKTKRPCLFPVIAGDLLYVSCRDKKLYAIDPLTGDERWHYDNRKATPPPSVFSDGVLYTLGTDGYLTAMR